MSIRSFQRGKGTNLKHSSDSTTHDHVLLLRHKVQLFDSIIDAVREEAAPHKRTLNEHAPIHRLPVELLTDIFYSDILSQPKKQPMPYLLKDPKKRPMPYVEGAMTRLQELSLVCVRWKDLVISTPKLWSDIRFGRDGELAMKLSRDSLIDVTCENDSVYLHPEDGCEDPLKAFLRLVIPESRRWRSFFVSGPRVTEDVLECLQRQAPALTSLTAKLRPYPPSPAITIPATNTSLRHLDLAGISVAWDASRLANLTSLSLLNILITPPIPALMSVLQASPQLVSLSLVSVGIMSQTYLDEDAATVDGGSAISLPGLSQLKLWSMAPSLQHHLISSIIAPSLTSLVISSKSYRHLQRESPVSLFHLFSKAIDSSTHIWVYHAVASDLSITAGNQTENQWPAPPDNAPINILITGPISPEETMEVAAFIQAACKPTTKIQFSIVGYLDDEDEEAPPDVDTVFPVAALGLLSSLDHLAVDTLGDAVNVLTYLSNGLSGWPCNKLRSLDLAAVQGLQQENVDMFELGRYGPDLEDGVRPPRLDRLLLPHVLDPESDAEEVEIDVDGW